MRIHDPDVVYTDLGLALLGGWLAWRLWSRRGDADRSLTAAFTLVMGGLASAAFFGAVFHAFFPADTATPAGFIAWIPVVLSILLVASTLLWLSLALLAPALSTSARRAGVALYAAAFAAVVLLINESFGTIVRFYAPTLLLFVAAAVAQARRQRDTGWWYIAAALMVSILAALLQQAGVALHATYFDHNAVYHVLQGIALVLLFIGFRGVRPARSSPSAVRPA